MHGPRCFLQEPPGHVHLCMGAYGEHSSRLCNFEGFKLVTNLKKTKEAKCNVLYRFVQPDLNLVGVRQVMYISGLIVHATPEKILALYII